MDHVVDVIDALCSFVLIAYHYFLGGMQIVFCYLGYGWRHCGREHQRSPVLRDPLEDGIDAVGESRRPGVATMICTPRLKLRIWFSIDVPPYMGRTLSSGIYLE